MFRKLALRRRRFPALGPSGPGPRPSARRPPAKAAAAAAAAAKPAAAPKPDRPRPAAARRPPPSAPPPSGSTRWPAPPSGRARSRSTRTDAEAGVQLAAAPCARSASYDEAAQAARRGAGHRSPNNVEAMLELGPRPRRPRARASTPSSRCARPQALAPRDWRLPSLLGVAYDQVSRGDGGRGRLAPGPGPVAEQSRPCWPTRPCTTPPPATWPRAEQPAAHAPWPSPAPPSGSARTWPWCWACRASWPRPSSSSARTCRPSRPRANLAYLRAAAGGAGRSWERMRRSNCTGAPPRQGRSAAPMTALTGWGVGRSTASERQPLADPSPSRPRRVAADLA